MIKVRPMTGIGPHGLHADSGLDEVVYLDGSIEKRMAIVARKPGAPLSMLCLCSEALMDEAMRAVDERDGQAYPHRQIVKYPKRPEHYPDD